MMNPINNGKFALEKPAFRILVNTVASIGAIGYTNSNLTLQ